ncbi:hypothetical protein J1N35_021571 [Gossypium stocksii]|uniref:Zinc finger MYM-type protein 1-like n=1 Tax=Gossypium stocksii TaxID=47602 RepID=A0A9D3VEU0_9ROSI|nr:hypothetical protein J1N35_021571 [Gossypium stocksii]
MKSKTIDSFFKKKSTETTQSPSEASQIEVPYSSSVPLNSDARPSKIPRVEDEALGLSNLEREPGLRCAFRGHDESSGSKNRGNFLELLSLLSSYDEKVEDVLKSAPQNASYTSSTIQKEILQIYASKVRNVIREEIGDRKFSIIVDEARDESKKEQMVIILRFVDEQGQVKERFFDIVHVKDTASLNLKNVIFNVLLQHSFDIQNIRGQGYDGASNMRGEFSGLQALILNDCRYAYYVHCFTHRLHLALVAAAREVVKVHQFFKDLSDIVNIASASSKRRDELQKAQAAEITRLVSINELATGTGMNQIGTLQRPDMNAQYVVGCSRNKKEDVTVEHHYRVDIFFATIDTQLQELKSRFNENVVELLTLTTALDPKEFFKLFDIDKICILVNKFYPEDFSQQEKERLSYELKHYELDVCTHPDLRKISTLSELCRSLVESGKSVMYPLVDRLIRLILTLPVSTASSERAFSAMKIVKTRLRNKMEDDFLRSSLVVYIEKEIAEKFDVNEIIDDFSKVKDRRVQFK